MTALGFRQNWGMFAPNVGTTNGHSYAAITYNDGLVRCCETPYLWVMNEFYKYRYEKYEAYFEALDFDFNYDLKPSVCAYFARAFFDPKNPVYMVSLSAKGASYPVHPFVLQSELPEHTETSTCFNFKPQQGD